MKIVSAKTELEPFETFISENVHPNLVHNPNRQDRFITPAGAVLTFSVLFRVMFEQLPVHPTTNVFRWKEFGETAPVPTWDVMLERHNFVDRSRRKFSLWIGVSEHEIADPELMAHGWKLINGSDPVMIVRKVFWAISVPLSLIDL